MPTRDTVLQIRLSASERQQLEQAARARGWTMAQLLREFIRQLPPPRETDPTPELGDN